jgi:hypothetical protein
LRVALKQDFVDVRDRAAQHQRVTIGTGACDRRDTKRTAAATDVLNHDRAEERFHPIGQWTSDGVKRAARRKRNHKPD